MGNSPTQEGDEIITIPDNKQKNINLDLLLSTQENEKTKIIFDTDIGSDIDDSLALLLLLHLPKEKYELLGITTVYGFSNIRAAVTQKIISAYEEENEKLNVPIIAGSNYTTFGISLMPFWHANTEGVGVLTDDEIKKFKKMDEFVLDKKSDNWSASQFIVDTVNKYPGEVTIICLGALTNVAKAIELDNKVSKNMKRIVFMGGSRNIF
jgi:purine nucleosidase